MKPGLCWLLGHSRGPVSDRIEYTEHADCPHVRTVRFCGCCGKRADGFSLVRKVQLGEAIPRGYGVAWVRYCAPTAVLLPIPFNLMAGALYRLCHWVRAPKGLSSNPAEAYRQGRRAGYLQGREDEVRARLLRGIHQNGPAS